VGHHGDDLTSPQGAAPVTVTVTSASKTHRIRRSVALVGGAMAVAVALPLLASCQPGPPPGPASPQSTAATAVWVADHIGRWTAQPDRDRTTRVALERSAWTAGEAAALEVGGRRLAARWTLRWARGGSAPATSDVTYWSSRIGTSWSADRVAAHVVAHRLRSASDAEWLRMAASVLLGRSDDRPLGSYWDRRLATSGRTDVALGLARSSESRRALARHVATRIEVASAEVLASLLARHEGDVTRSIAVHDARSAPPVARPGRRIAVVGSSLAWQLGGGPTPPGVRRTLAGAGQTSVPCDWTPLPIVTAGTDRPADRACVDAPRRIADYVRRTSADAVIYTYGLRSLFDLRGPSGLLRHGSPEHTAAVAAGIRRHVDAVRSVRPDALIWLQEVACHRLRSTTTSGEEHDLTRLATVNQILRDVASTHPGVAVLPYAAQVCTGDGTQLVPGVRPDGAHLTDDAQVRWWRDAARSVDAG
jgi:hypothetical protein